MDSPFLTLWQTALLRGGEELRIELSEDQVARLRAHLALVLAHTERAGLTSLRDPVEIAVKHYLDSLTCLLAREIARGERVADVGSGGGFPGMVLAVVRPEAQYTLLESAAKRAAFLRLAAQELALTNVTVTAARAEEAGANAEHREQYDLALSRAVAPLPVLVEYLLPLVRVGGQALAMKGPEAADEVTASQQALAVLGGRIAEVKGFSLPEAKGERALVLMDKVAPTPGRYPRRPGIPAKRPL